MFESVDIFIFRSKRRWCNENRWIDAPANAHQLLLLLLSSHKLEQLRRKKSGKIEKWSDTLTCGMRMANFLLLHTKKRYFSPYQTRVSVSFIVGSPSLAHRKYCTMQCVCLSATASERRSLLSTIKTIFFVQTNAIKVIANFECTWNHVLNPIPDKTQQPKKEFEVGVLRVFCSHRRHARQMNTKCEPLTLLAHKVCERGIVQMMNVQQLSCQE